MKRKILFPIAALLTLAVFLGGCATGMTPSSWHGMTADADYAYVSGGTHVYALNLATQAEAWRFQIKATVFASPVLTPGGELLVGGYDHVLYSLDPADGSEYWQFDEARDRWIGSPLVADERIYAPNADYNLYTLDLRGNRLWSFKADQSLWGTPVSDGEKVYFGSLGGRIYALEAATGEPAWGEDGIELEGAILGTPVLHDGVLYVGLFTGSLVALDVRDGRLLWEQTLDSWAWSGPLLEGDALYIGDGDGRLYAFGLDGDQLWKQELNGAIVGPPILINGEIAVGTDTGNVYLVSLDGEDIRTISVSGQVQGPLLAAGMLLLASPTDSDFLVVALQDGTQAWNFTPAK